MQTYIPTLVPLLHHRHKIRKMGHLRTTIDDDRDNVRNETTPNGNVVPRSTKRDDVHYIDADNTIHGDKVVDKDENDGTKEVYWMF